MIGKMSRCFFIIFHICLYCNGFEISVLRADHSHLLVSLLCDVQQKFEPKQMIVILTHKNLSGFMDGFLGCANIPLQIYNEDRPVLHPQVKAANESAVILLHDTEVPLLLSSLNILPKTPQFRVWVVFTDKVSRSRVQNAFQVLWTKGYVNAVVIRHLLHKIYLYRYFPFSDKTCNQPVEPVLQRSWTPGTAIPEDVFRSYHITNFRGCTLKCGTFHHPPAVIVVNTDGRTEMHGIIGHFAQVVSRALNFRCHLSTPTDGAGWGYTFSNGTSYGLQGDVADNVVDVAFADFLQSVQRWQATDMIKAYREDCLTMVVPSGLGILNNSIWAVLFDEFSFEMWSFLSLAIAGSAFFAGFISRTSPTESLWSFTSSVVYVVMTFFGGPVRSRPESAAARIFVATWLSFSMVIGIAYLASFSSLVTVPWRPSDIDTLAAVFKANLTVYTYPTLLVFLADEDNSSMEALIAKRAVTTTQPLSFLMANLAARRDHAVLFPKMKINFEMAALNRSEADKFHVLKDLCVSRTMVSPILSQRGSPMTGPLDDTVDRVIESGLVHFWQQSIPLSRHQETRTADAFSLRNVISAFVVHAIGLAVATAIFIFERILPPNKRC